AHEPGDTTIPYDYLILATGSSHTYFGHPEWANRAPGLKTLDDALEIRRQVLLSFEAAERETDEAAQRRLLTFVIIGGGPPRPAWSSAARSAKSRSRRCVGTFGASAPRPRTSCCSRAVPRFCPRFPKNYGKRRANRWSGWASTCGPIPL